MTGAGKALYGHCSLSLVLWMCAVVGCGKIGVEATRGSDVAASQSALNHGAFSPQVAFQCGFRNRYLSEDGSWITDTDHRARCPKETLEILKYCRKVYSNKSISNIVESSHFTEIHNWCREEGQPCKWSFWSRPYHCIIGEYESEPLLVPDGCQFAHVDDRNLCANFSYWNATAIQNCANRNGQRVLSFSMLESCGLDRFSGVQFVCCPRKATQVTNTAVINRLKNVNAKPQNDEIGDATAYNADDGNDDEDESDEYDGDDDSQYDRIDTSLVTKLTATASSLTKASSAVTIATNTKSYQMSKDDDEDDDDDDEDDEDDDFEEKDPYFRVADPKREHEFYHAALQRLEQRHRQKVAKEMKEWSELETRYQEIKQKDPKYAEQFKNEMTSRFQKTVAALEEENKDERLQVEEVHQQRVMAEMNQKKRAALKTLRASLYSQSPGRKNHVLHAMKALFRVLEKNRTHSLNRYRHLLRSDREAAESFKPSLQKQLRDIDQLENDTIAELRKVPADEKKIRTAILEFWQIYRQENTPDVSSDYLTSIYDPFSNERLLAFYETQYRSKYDDGDDKSKRGVSGVDVVSVFTHQQPQSLSRSAVETRSGSMTSGKQTGNDKEGVQKAYHYKPLDSFVKKNNLVQEFAFHEERNSGPQHHSRFGYVILAVGSLAFVAVIVFGTFIVRRRSYRSARGFVEVDACTPEERHVACMQINGYENPAYKYFEDRS